MATAITTGAQSNASFYRAKLNATGDGYDILNKLTDTVAAAPTLTTDVAYQLLSIGSSKPSFQDDDTIKFSFDQVDNSEDFWSFRNKVVSVTAEAGKMEDYYLENGVNVGGSGSGGLESPVIIIWYGPKNKLTGADKVQVFIAAGTITATTGTFDTKKDSFNKPTFEFSGVKLPYDLAIAIAMFDTTVVDAPAAVVTLPAESGHYIGWLAIAE